MEFAVDTTEASADTRAPAGMAELAVEAKAAAGMAMASRTGRTWDLLDASSGPTDRTVWLRNSPSEFRWKAGPGNQSTMRLYRYLPAVARNPYGMQCRGDIARIFPGPLIPLNSVLARMHG